MIMHCFVCKKLLTGGNVEQVIIDTDTPSNQAVRRSEMIKCRKCGTTYRVVVERQNA